jgi:Rab GDP dissociation inhibitor
MFSSEKIAVCKVPADEIEAAKSSLMGIFEKTRLVKFINYLLKLELSDKKTWGDHDLNKVPMSKIYEKFGFCENTIDFLGHAVALHHSDTYLVEPAYDTLAKM